jgi:pyrroline-5-carboxylate reductase
MGLQYYVVDDRLAPDKFGAKIKLFKNVSDVPSMQADIIVIAIKPQGFADSLPALIPFITPDTVILTIAAGIPLQRVRDLCKLTAQPLVRAMPNTPGAVGRGITAAFATHEVEDTSRQTVEKLLQALGKVVWLDREELLDPVTALSGSGPAYVFLLVEAMAQAGERLGLPADVALVLARETVIGSGILLDQSNEAPSVLRGKVTSKGGTTEAALDVLMADRSFVDLMQRALSAANDRAKELAKK